MTVAEPARRPSTEGLAVATQGLVKRYGPRAAVAGLDLNVPRGMVYGFLGPNGSGKTTTLRLLVGMARPDAGTIELLGEPYSWRDRRRLFRVGSLIEQPSFYPYLSGRDNLRVFGASGPPTPKHRAEEVLGFVGLRERAGDKVKTYSLGMKQRLGIAAALLSDPELLLLDEPANGLDPGGIVAMRELLRFLTSQGKTVLVSSHILPEMEQMADVVGIIAAGRLVREGPLASILGQGTSVRVRVRESDVGRALEILAALSPSAEAAVGGFEGPRWVSMRVAPDQASEVNRALAQGGVFASGLETGSDLETVFLSLTGPGTPDEGQPGPPPGWGQPGGRAA
ncbi:MAG: ATP-binding cassette domain-containing protein [Chloroflexota bacterium]|nr:ATP-binding cassette domain-containing protein [Chloroflexota bacterium]